MPEPVFAEHVVRPAPELRPYVGAYVGYHMAGFPPGVHAGLPSRSITCVIALDGGVDLVRLPRDGQPPAVFGSLVGGLHHREVWIRHDGTQRGIQLDLTPRGVRRLFGMPAAEVASLVVSLPDLLGRPGDELVERVALAPTWSTRFAALDDGLAQVLGPGGDARPEVAHAWDRLTSSHGQVAVGALAREVGWSRRHLTTQFEREYGLRPKLVGRISRFERASSLLRSTPQRSLAEVAATCGYADQPHMTRDWQAFAGTSPAAWLEAEVFPSVQDDGAPIG